MDWWDWWITTTVALPLAAVALAVAFFAQRRELKGALLLVALVAVGLGIAAPFVMGKSGSSRSAMGGERLTAQEFARWADATCRRLGQSPAWSLKPKTIVGTARQLNVLAPAIRNGVRAQSRLRPPSEEQATAGRWMGAMSAFADDYEAARAAAKRGDARGVKSAFRRSNVHAAQSARLSKQLGLSVCFQ